MDDRWVPALVVTHIFFAAECSVLQKLLAQQKGSDSMRFSLRLVFVYSKVPALVVTHIFFPAIYCVFLALIAQ